jgi:hypothetical protein
MSAYKGQKSISRGTSGVRPTKRPPLDTTPIGVTRSSAPRSVYTSRQASTGRRAGKA